MTLSNLRRRLAMLESTREPPRDAVKAAAELRRLLEDFVERVERERELRRDPGQHRLPERSCSVRDLQVRYAGFYDDRAPDSLVAELLARGAPGKFSAHPERAAEYLAIVDMASRFREFARAGQKDRWVDAEMNFGRDEWKARLQGLLARDWTGVDPDEVPLIALPVPDAG